MQYGKKNLKLDKMIVYLQFYLDLQRVEGTIEGPYITSIKF